MAQRSFHVTIGDQVFIDAMEEEVGAVRKVAHDHLVVYIENSGDFQIEGPAVKAVHSGKVVLDPTQLSPELLTAAQHAHEHETD